MLRDGAPSKCHALLFDARVGKEENGNYTTCLQLLLILSVAVD